MEAVKTKMAQIKYQLLQIYMDYDNIIKYIQLWKQMVAFFICTQRHSWNGKKLKYQLDEKETNAFGEIMN